MRLRVCPHNPKALGTFVNHRKTFQGQEHGRHVRWQLGVPTAPCQGPLTKLPVSFADAVSRRQAEHQARIKHSMAYWLEELQARGGLFQFSERRNNFDTWC